nr:VOC family protein [Auraticoccus cholistanensis]
MEEVPAAVGFWSAALGVPAEPEPDEPQYTSLPGAVPGLVTAVQAVDDAPRYHLDIETDDVAAETTRLLGLGAVQVAEWAGCQVLRVPGGQLVCVIPLHSDPAEFAAAARRWE